MGLTSYDESIRDYLIGRLKENFPDLAINSGSPILDLFINPQIDILKPFLTVHSRIDYMQNLANADSMTESELDLIGVNNYGVTRREGVKASGYVYVEVEPNFIDELPFIIGPITVANGDYQYSSLEDTIVRINDTDIIDLEGSVVQGVAADYLNSSTGNYEFPVYVLAKDYGTDYNCKTGEINTLITTYATLTGKVGNKDDFNNGYPLETNESYVERIKSSLMFRAYGTYPGYRSYVLDNFPGAHDVYVAGYGDTPMQRDKVIKKVRGRMEEITEGGKVDLYVRGTNYTEFKQDFYYKSNRFRLYNPLIVGESHIVVHNLTAPERNSYNVVLEYENPDTKTGYLDIIIEDNGGTLPQEDDELLVKYISYVDESLTDTFMYEETFYYMSNKLRLLRTPFQAVSEIRNVSLGNISIPIADSPEGTEDEETGDYGSLINPIFDISTTYPVIEVSTTPDQTGLALNEFKLNPDIAVYMLDWYVGKTLYIHSGPGAGEIKEIVEYNEFTKVVTLDSNFDVQPVQDESGYYIRDNRNFYENSAKDVVDISLKEDTMYTPEEGDPVEAFTEGDLVSIFYLQNSLVQDIQYDLDVRENRAITTDVLAREAKPVFLYFAMRIKCNRNKTITYVERNLISMYLNEVIARTSFNSTIQYSDIINILYSASTIRDFMDYIEQPAVFFSSPTALSLTDEELIALTDSQYKQSEIKFVDTEYPVLAKLVVQKIN